MTRMTCHTVRPTSPRGRELEHRNTNTIKQSTKQHVRDVPFFLSGSNRTTIYLPARWKGGVLLIVRWLSALGPLSSDQMDSHRDEEGGFYEETNIIQSREQRVDNSPNTVPIAMTR